jgi:sugar O-acyltransferase (sialic acid O-acetyltransferase NeuD family)
MKPVIVLGAGGVGHEIREFIENDKGTLGGNYYFHGYLDDNLEISRLGGVPWLGTIDDYAKFEDSLFISSIGSAADPRLRSKIKERVVVPINRWATIVHSAANVSPSAHLYPGTVIYPGCQIGANVEIREHCFLAYNVTVAHESVINEGTVLASGVNIAGEVTVGAECYVGPTSSIAHGITVGDSCMLGIGSVVVRDISKKTRVIQMAREFRLDN